MAVRPAPLTLLAHSLFGDRSVDSESPPASLARRFVNLAVDSNLIAGISGLLLGETPLSSSFSGLAFLGSFGVVSAVYYTSFEFLVARTPGKMLSGTRVVVLGVPRGQRPFVRLLMRSLVRLVPFEPLSLLFSSRDRAWHDFVSATLVVRS